VNFLAGVLQKLSTLQVAPGLSIVVCFWVRRDSNAETVSGSFVLLVTSIFLEINSNESKDEKDRKVVLRVSSASLNILNSMFELWQQKKTKERRQQK
jgi:hypothetical protein